MSWQEKIDEIELRRQFAHQLGGEASVARQHAQGRFTARERVEKLVDSGSWRELGILAGKAKYDSEWKVTGVQPANVIIGTAHLDGRKVVVSSDDFTVRGGSSDAAV